MVRVPQHTADTAKKAIRFRTREDLVRIATDGSEAIERLGDLERELDIEKALKANAKTVALVGLDLGCFVNRRLTSFPRPSLDSCSRKPSRAHVRR